MYLDFMQILGQCSTGLLVYDGHSSLHPGCTMFCHCVSNSLHFSKVYVCSNVSLSVAWVLVAVLLATSKLTDFPTLDGVSFGQPKSVLPSKGQSRLLQFWWKINVQPVWRFLPPLQEHLLTLSCHIGGTYFTCYCQLCHCPIYCNPPFTDVVGVVNSRKITGYMSEWCSMCYEWDMQLMHS